MLQLASQSGYVDIHLDRIRDTAERQLNHVQQVATSTLPRTTTTNIDGEDIENVVDQSSSQISETVNIRNSQHYE
jgi:hypothetical protein